MQGQQAIASSTNTFMITMRIVSILVTLGMVALNAWFLYYVEELKAKGCECAIGWRRTFIQASLVAFILVGIAGLFVDLRKNFLWLNLGMFIVFVAYVAVAREFIDDVKHAMCKCAQGEAFKVLDIVNILQIAVLVVYAIALLIMIFFMATVGRSAIKAKAGIAPAAAAATPVRAMAARRRVALRRRR